MVKHFLYVVLVYHQLHQETDMQTAPEHSRKRPTMVPVEIKNINHHKYGYMQILMVINIQVKNLGIFVSLKGSVTDVCVTHVHPYMRDLPQRSKCKLTL